MIVDGAYADHGDHVRASLLLNDDQWRRLHSAVLEAQQLLQRGVKPKVVERRLLEDAAIVSPEAASLLSRLERPSSMALATWLALLFELIGLVVPLVKGNPVEAQQQQVIHDQHELIVQYQRLLEQAEAL